MLVHVLCMRVHASWRIPEIQPYRRSSSQEALLHFTRIAKGSADHDTAERGGPGRGGQLVARPSVLLLLLLDALGRRSGTAAESSSSRT